MSVGGIRGGGGKGRAGGAKGPAGKGAAGKASGGFGGKVGKADPSAGLVGPSGAAGTSEAAAVDPVTAQALELARKLKSGEIGSKEEATRKFVADILKEKLRMQSKALTSKVAEALEKDPRLNQALERLWQKG